MPYHFPSKILANPFEAKSREIIILQINTGSKTAQGSIYVAVEGNYKLSIEKFIKILNKFNLKIIPKKIINLIDKPFSMVKRENWFETTNRENLNYLKLNIDNYLEGPVCHSGFSRLN